MALSALFAVPSLLAAAPPQVREPAPFPLAAQSAIVLDAESGKVLYARDADTMRYPASTTKIMTTLLLLERCKLTDIVTAPKDVTKVGEASMHLKPWEKVTVRDLAYAMMLRSANDGCYSAAVHLAGSVPRFAQMMNARAREIGCEHTNFVNPNGLNDKGHMISARDLALIGREAMRNPTFAQIARTPKFRIERSKNKADRWMVSRNRLLREDPTADGIKTGWTIPAGHTYVGSATRGGHRLITAILDSPHWKQDHLELLKWGFGAYERRPVALRTMVLGEVPVAGGAKGAVPVRPSEDVSTLARKGSWAAPKLELPTEPVSAPIAAGQVVGRAVFVEPGGFRHEVPILATESVERGALPAVAAKVTGSPLGWIGAAGFAVGAFALFARRRRPGRVIASNGFTIKPLRAAGSVEPTESRRG